jgi:para-nitrobenzyl esterase
MVWVHGGGFVTGGSSEARQNGEFLAHHGVIVVSMNYRLGFFGFLTHPQLRAESGHNSAGNYGLLDILAALQWVQQNAASFGGDSSNVTIFGESAGSMAVSDLMASPLAQGLMARAIGESGASLRSGFDGQEPTPEHDMEVRDLAFLQKSFHTASLDKLRLLPPDALLPAITAKGSPRFTPDIDGYFLPESVASIYAAGKQAHIPLLAGWNADERRAGGRSTPTIAAFNALAKKDFGPRAGDFLKLYPAATDAQALLSAGDYAGDKFIAYATWRWIESQVATGGSPVYRYFFALPTAGDRVHPFSDGAYHSDDIAYIFGTLDSRPDIHLRPEDRILSDQMGQYWVNFARTGDPNGPGLPLWPIYAPDKWRILRLDAAPKSQPDTLRPRYLFLNEFWGKTK